MNRVFTIQSLFFTAIMAMLGAGCAMKHQNNEEREEKEVKAERVVLTHRTLSEIRLEVLPAERRTLAQEIIVPAKLVTNQDHEALVGTLVQGRVSGVSANLGDHVSKGQVLMQIEGVEIGEIKSLFTKAKAQLTYAEAALKRQQTLVQQNAGSQKALLEAQAEYEKANAEYIAEDRRIHSIGLDDEDIEGLDEHSQKHKRESHIGGILPIKSPIDGTVVDRNVVIGQLVDPSTTAFRIVNSSVLWIDGQLHESEANQIPKDADASVVIPSLGGKSFAAKLIYVGEIIDQQTRMVKIRAEIRNPQHAFKPEMFAEMHLKFANSAKGVIVNAGSIVKDGAEQYVFVAVNDTTFEKRPVAVGRSSGEQVEIVKGVTEGEKIVGEGAFLLKSELKKSMFAEEE